MKTPSRPGRRPGTTAGDLSRIGAGAHGEDGPLVRGGRGAPYLVPIALSLLAVAALWFGRGWLASLGSALESPDTQLRRALGNQVRAELDDVYGFRSGGTVQLHGLRFEDVATSVEGRRATVVAVLTAEGRVSWRGQQSSLAYVGRERFHMVPCRMAVWCGEGDQFGRLRGVLLALFRHRDALEQRDLAQLASLAAPDYSDAGEDRAALLNRARRELAGPTDAPARVSGWQVRVERDRAEVGEDSSPSGDAGEAGRGRRVYRLARVEGRWLFTAGL